MANSQGTSSKFTVGLGIAIAGVAVAAGGVIAAWLFFWERIAVGTPHKIQNWQFVIYFFTVLVFWEAYDIARWLVRVAYWEPSDEEADDEPQRDDHFFDQEEKQLR